MRHRIRVLVKSGLVVVIAALAALATPEAGEAARLPKGFTEKVATVDGVRINYKTGGHARATACAADAYDRMMSGKARFRVVLEMG